MAVDLGEDSTGQRLQSNDPVTAATTGSSQKTLSRMLSSFRRMSTGGKGKEEVVGNGNGRQNRAAGVVGESSCDDSETSAEATVEEEEVDDNGEMMDSGDELEDENGDMMGDLGEKGDEISNSADKRSVNEDYQRHYVARTPVSEQPFGTVVRWIDTRTGRKHPVCIFRPVKTLLGMEARNSISKHSKYRLIFKMVRAESKLIRSTLCANGFREAGSNFQDFNIMWTGGAIKPYSIRTFNEHQKVNHFPRSYELTRKDKLFKNISRMKQIYGSRHFDFIPKSFVLPNEYNEFYGEYIKDRGPWIVKPVASSQGRGIYIINHINQVPVDEPCVIARYIDNPLTVDGFKFDLRLYVVVTSFDPLVVYMYEEGLVRFATEKYDRSNRNLSEAFMHLTNYSVNKKNENYVSNTDADIDDYGNKWSLSALLRCLKEMGINTSMLMLQIEDLVNKTLLSAEVSISSACKMFVPHRGNCFELFGFDVLVDENLKPWLLEVNLSPSLSCDAPIDHRIKSHLIADMFTLVGVTPYDQIKHKEQARQKQLRLLSRNIYRSGYAKKPAQRKISHEGSDLSVEERNILFRIQEEEKRRGNLVRLFPTEDSWDLYSPFLENKTSFNRMVHSNLYPDRFKSGSKYKNAFVIRSKRFALSNVSFNCLETVSSLERVKKYENKLFSRSEVLSENGTIAHDVMQTSGFKMASGSRPSSGAVSGNSTSSRTGVNSGTPTDPNGASRERSFKITVDSLLSNGKVLNALQARSAFTIYLERVRRRLENGISGRDNSHHFHESSDHEEQQLDLILRFLKRASSNIPSSTFSVVVPNRRLAIRDRERILAKQLGDFIRIYCKETERLVAKKELDMYNGDEETTENGINKNDFEIFLCVASESELEELLAHFTKHKKSANLFLGGPLEGDTPMPTEAPRVKSAVVGRTSSTVNSEGAQRPKSSKPRTGPTPSESASVEERRFGPRPASSIGHHRTNTTTRQSMGSDANKGGYRVSSLAHSSSRLNVKESGSQSNADNVTKTNNGRVHRPPSAPVYQSSSASQAKSNSGGAFNSVMTAKDQAGRGESTLLRGNARASSAKSQPSGSSVTSSAPSSSPWSSTQPVPPSTKKPVTTTARPLSASKKGATGRRKSANGRYSSSSSGYGQKWNSNTSVQHSYQPSISAKQKGSLSPYDSFGYSSTLAKTQLKDLLDRVTGQSLKRRLANSVQAWTDDFTKLLNSDVSPLGHGSAKMKEAGHQNIAFGSYKPAQKSANANEIQADGVKVYSQKYTSSARRASGGGI